MAAILFANNAKATLAGAITNTSLTANLQAGQGALFPTPGAGQYFCGTFVDAATGLITEIVHVTAISGDTITMVRGQEGTTAENWASGDLFANRLTAGSMAAMVQATGANGYSLGALIGVQVFSFVGATQEKSINGGAFSSTGATTYTPTAGMAHAVVHGCGGGAGGGGAVTNDSTHCSLGGGGSAGSDGLLYLTAAQIGASQTITLGAGGAAGAAGNNAGSNGGATSIGSLMSFPGGIGGAGGITAGFANVVGGGSSPSPPSGTALLLVGSAGQPGGLALLMSGSPGNGVSGSGGDSRFGSGGYVAGISNSAATPGNPGTGPGAGGSGAAVGNSQTQAAGAAGLGGLMIIFEYA